jgi:radical SAM protein
MTLGVKQVEHGLSQVLHAGARGPERQAHGVRVPRVNVAVRPMLVLFETTRACDLACLHCRAEAAPYRDSNELGTDDVSAVLDDLASLGAPRPVVVLTGGDPFKRADLAELVSRGTEKGLAMAVSPSGTPLATRTRLAELYSAGARVVSFSLDGASAARHDAFRGVKGSFAWTIGACRAAKEVGLRLQVNTTVTATTVWDLPGILRLVLELEAGLWSVFFLVTTGRGRGLEPLPPQETEDALHFLYDVSDLVPLKTTEAPQYRRLVLQREARLDLPELHHGPLYGELHKRLSEVAAQGAGEGKKAPGSHHRPRPPLAVGDGRGVVFISHTGDVSPSGFLPLVAGNVRQVCLTDIYREAPLFQRLRDPDQLGGRCGRCEYRAICGGSRARAYATYGDPFAEDPSCPYVPGPSLPTPT